MSRTAVITDVHGRLDPLQRLLDRVGDAKIICLGDMVDRGTQSSEVVAVMRTLHEAGAVVLRGNHEDMVCADDPRLWLSNGGAPTLLSYRHPLTGALNVEAMQGDVVWFRSLPRIHSDAHRVYVHAGVVPNLSLAEQPESITQWMRYPDGMDVGWQGLHVVHGHSVGLFQGQHRTCLDAGMGAMCCGLFDDDVAGGPVELLWT
jgi:serine/threonine protein phosphatase 1